MSERKYLNEKNYQQTNEKVKKTGGILIIVGLVMLTLGFILTITGLLGFGNSASNSIQNDTFNSGIFANLGSFAIGGFLMGPGAMIAFIGLILRFLIGNGREITAYSAQQVMPVAKEGIEEMAPTVGYAAKEIAKGIKEGINEADGK